jgi:putative transposase
MNIVFKKYPHNPPHLFLPNAHYMVTGTTLHKEKLFNTDNKKSFLCGTLLERSYQLGWDMEAWSVMDNHYHFIAKAPEDASTLSKLIRQIHSITAREVNVLDGTPGRKVWYNYWDSCITSESAYYARLKYVHLNPLKHGMVDIQAYPFCSYGWFLSTGSADLKQRVAEQTIAGTPLDDDF